jgi:multimeric flavodoxin WrbA
MMKAALINGSPKRKHSVSLHMLEYLRGALSPDCDCVPDCNVMRQSGDEILEAVRDCGALVFAFPLYVDGIPSHLLAFLDEARDRIAGCAAPGAKVYALINNGFYEARQNSLALAMMKRFCERAGLSWGGGVCAGAGGMIQSLPIGRGPMRNLGRALDAMAGNISRLATAEDVFVPPNFPRFLYILMGHHGWKSYARRHGMKPKQLYGKPNAAAAPERSRIRVLSFAGFRIGGRSGRGRSRR